MVSGKSIFISYASEDREQAYRIKLALQERGLTVFFDRDGLLDGGAYHSRLHKEITSCAVFVFLVSPHSLNKGRYTLTELTFARDKWPHPKDRVLPVLLAPPGKIADDVKDLWIYLEEVSPVRARGHIAAEVTQRVIDMLNRATILPRVAASLRSLNLGNYFKGGIGKSMAYANSDLDEDIISRHREKGGRISAGELKEKLKSKSILKQPQCLTVTGHFFPSALLSFGWWERVNKRLDNDIEWKDPALQQWLFSGFEQWAPSWDVNDWSNDKPFKLVGQIGENDEADSIPVLIKSERKARDIRERLMTRLVVTANVVGCLCHESHLRTLPTLDQDDSEFLETIKEMSSAQYYLLLLDQDDSHTVEVLTNKVDYYSGYIWQCWAPKEWTPSDPYDTRLPGAYFVWEHTNLADADVIRYGLDSLDMKVRYLRKRLQEKLNLSGDLVLLQHLMSHARLRGEAMTDSQQPAIPTEHFRNLFLSRATEKNAA